MTTPIKHTALPKGSTAIRDGQEWVLLNAEGKETKRAADRSLLGESVPQAERLFESLSQRLTAVGSDHQLTEEGLSGEDWNIRMESGVTTHPVLYLRDKVYAAEGTVAGPFDQGFAFLVGSTRQRAKELVERLLGESQPE